MAYDQYAPAPPLSDIVYKQVGGVLPVQCNNMNVDSIKRVHVLKSVCKFI